MGQLPHKCKCIICATYFTQKTDLNGLKTWKQSINKIFNFLLGSWLFWRVIFTLLFREVVLIWFLLILLLCLRVRFGWFFFFLLRVWRGVVSIWFPFILLRVYRGVIFILFLFILLLCGRVFFFFLLLFLRVFFIFLDQLYLVCLAQVLVQDEPYRSTFGLSFPLCITMLQIPSEHLPRLTLHSVKGP